ncbi:hypothetical protein TYM08_P1903 [Marinicellulosiphila megalodicopiae]
MSKTMIRVISIIMTVSLFVGIIFHNIGVSISRFYFPDSYNGYPIAIPILLFTFLIYFLICTFTGRFLIWKSGTKES